MLDWWQRLLGKRITQLKHKPGIWVLQPWLKDGIEDIRRRQRRLSTSFVKSKLSFMDRTTWDMYLHETCPILGDTCETTKLMPLKANNCWGRMATKCQTLRVWHEQRMNDRALSAGPILADKHNQGIEMQWHAQREKSARWQNEN